MKYIIMLMLLFCNYANAGCTAASNPIDYLDFGSVIVQRDAPVGSVIATKTLPSSIVLDSCDNSQDYGYQLLNYNGGVASSIPNVYLTNITGVGVSVMASSYYTNPAAQRGPFANGYVTTQPIVVSLYKLQQISSGNLALGQVAVFKDSAGRLARDMRISGGRVTQVACSISTPSLIFPIGDVLATSFGSTVGTVPSGAQNTQNLGLNCDNGANINVSLNGTQNPDVGTTSVLALTNQGGADVAKGVGVQILYNGSPLLLNNRIVMKQSSGGQETFPITARYYQTKTAVTTGKANASATLDLTYQ
ncbi:TPA: spore coat protein U domain-containing protein [Enterobacter mori]